MRKFLMTSALVVAALAASPAFAQDFSAAPDYTAVQADNSSGSFRAAPAYRSSVRRNTASYYRNGYNAFAYEPDALYGSSISPREPSCAGDLGYGRPDYSSC